MRGLLLLCDVFSGDEYSGYLNLVVRYVFLVLSILLDDSVWVFMLFSSCYCKFVRYVVAYRVPFLLVRLSEFLVGFYLGNVVCLCMEMRYGLELYPEV